MASSSLARPMAREMASFIAATWRLMVCPTEATDCSASLSGSASRTATSVMAEAMRRSSWARQTRSARNQKMTIGTRMATAAVSAEALPTKPDTPAEVTCVEMSPKAKKPTMRNQATEAASALGCRFGKLQGRLLGLLGRLRLGLLAFRLAALALALLGFEPLCQGGPLGKLEAPLKGWAIARLFVSLPGHCIKRLLRLIFCPCCRSSRLRLLLRHNAFLVTKRNS